MWTLFMSTCHLTAMYWIRLKSFLQIPLGRLSWTADGCRIPTSFRRRCARTTQCEILPRLWCLKIRLHMVGWLFRFGASWRSALFTLARLQLQSLASPQTHCDLNPRSLQQLAGARLAFLRHESEVFVVQAVLEDGCTHFRHRAAQTCP